MYALGLFIIAMILWQGAAPAPEWQVIAAFIGGALGRIFLPYLREWFRSDIKFDWKFLIGQVIGVAIALIPTIFIDKWMNALATMTWIASVSMGWAMADVGRESQKTLNVIKNGRKK